ncbi:MAG TPA: phosphopyruvate hydratase [Candidatus Thermoplasmatota archaeon]|nr:phosphopyruvate hydratase [Candidatus Thermoplasmatota archaeon]
MSAIEQVFLRKILDSRGQATVEVDVVLAGGAAGRAAAPSGASTGAHEVAAWPEGGVDAALAGARKMLPSALLGKDALRQREVDEALAAVDGTPNFRRLGGNVATAVSLAVAKAAAASIRAPLYAYLGGHHPARMPHPFGNVLGGGAHAVGGTDIQEFMAVSLSPRAQDNVFSNAFVHKRVKELLKQRLPGAAIGKGDEGAWVAPIPDEEALSIVAKACEEAESQFGFRIRPALDVAATELYKEGKYRYRDGAKSTGEQVKFLARLVEEFDLYSVEDPLAEDDWDGWIELTRAVGRRCHVVGDDLFVTNLARLKVGIEKGAANAILIKPNQIGTLTRTIDTIRHAHANRYETVVSHRSGETTDETIAHVAVAFGSLGIKTGAVGGERIAKLNELIRIEERHGRSETGGSAMASR